MRRSALMIIILAVTLGGCGSGDPGSDPDISGTPGSEAPSSTSHTPAETPAIVGEWHRLQDCSELEAVMTAVGLHDALLASIAEDGWIPGVTSVDQIEDPAHPCVGAVPRQHSHYFTADGQFGSRDANGEQVDDGRYELIGDNTVVISEVTFTYEITDDGDTISFTPMIPDCAPSCFEAGWSVAVAYPGYPWERVE